MLRGHASGYFTNPMVDGAAISAGDTQAMERFCQKAGFSEARFAAPAAQDSVVGDLLCASPSGSNQFNNQ